MKLRSPLSFVKDKLTPTQLAQYQETLTLICRKMEEIKSVHTIENAKDYIEITLDLKIDKNVAIALGYAIVGAGWTAAEGGNEISNANAKLTIKVSPCMWPEIEWF